MLSDQDPGAPFLRKKNSKISCGFEQNSEVLKQSDQELSESRKGKQGGIYTTELRDPHLSDDDSDHAGPGPVLASRSELPVRGLHQLVANVRERTDTENAGLVWKSSSDNWCTPRFTQLAGSFSCTTTRCTLADPERTRTPLNNRSNFPVCSRSKTKRAPFLT